MFRYVLRGVVILALGAALGPMTIAPASASEAEDTALWDRAKLSKNPDEVRAYLDKYPNGLYAPLARIRLRNMESAGGSPKPQNGSRSGSGSGSGSALGPASPPAQARSSMPPPPPVSTAPALTNPTVIREVQDLLYNLNYQIGPRNGRLTTETRNAIRKWQENVKLPVSGDMTVAQLALLRRARLPTVWGALAYHTKGATATTWNRSTRENAESEALAECRKKAHATCSVLTVASKICGALGFYNAIVGGRQHWGVYASIRPTLGQATENALSECRRQAKQPNACGVRITVCADGGHSR
jgi:peptidoglycan hydrolase-like protein with peptidoglycan-binding domain